MDNKIDKKNSSNDQNVLRKNSKFDKKLRKSLSSKEKDFDESNKSLLLSRNSFLSKKYNSDAKLNECLWNRTKNNSNKMKLTKNYNNCINNETNSKLIFIIKKCINNFFYLKKICRNNCYHSFTSNLSYLSTAINNRQNRKTCTYEKDHHAKHTEYSSLYDKIPYTFFNKIEFFRNIFNYSKMKKIDLNDLDKGLNFKNKNYEELFLNKFYSSFPLKMIKYSLLMLVISLLHFFILYYIVLKFTYGYTPFLTSLFKLFFDILYFLSFVVYILFFNCSISDTIRYYSYISCYFFVSFTILHSLILMQFLSTVDLNEFFISNYLSLKYIITTTNIYICIFCFLINYMIVYNFLMNLKFSFFCIICLFFFLFFSFHLKYQIKDIFLLFLFSIIKIFFSLYYGYKCERSYKIKFINRHNYEKVSKNNLTKYFSIDNFLPTTPVEDILHNLKILLDIIKHIEKESNKKYVRQIKKMKEKIEKCENILRTKNLNEVQTFKYRKIERIYNMWCLDKMDNKHNKNIENYSFLTQNFNKNKDLCTSFSNMQSLLSAKFQEHYNDAYEWNSDVELNHKGNIFLSIGYKLLYPLGILESSFDKEKLKKFLFKICSLYSDAPYHNSLHASQVAHLSKSLLFSLDMNHKISAIDEFCLHVSSLCHDVGHPGLNNYFLINSENDLALTYNDNSVLENYHCSLIFKSLKEENCNIFENYPYNIFINCKKNIIRAILSTDMKHHFKYISNFRTSKEFIDYNNLNTDQTWQIFCLILKAADIGHSALEWNKHYSWTLKINEEFYVQGLLEKSLNMKKSFLCDITTIDKLATSQIDFLKHLCIPLFNELNYICKNNNIYNHCICTIEKNIEQWEKKKNDIQNIGLQDKYKDENLINKNNLLKFI